MVIKWDDATTYKYKRRFPNQSFWFEGTWETHNSGEMASQNHFPLDTEHDSGGPWLMTKTEDYCAPAEISEGNWIGSVTLGENYFGWEDGDALFTSPQPTDLEMAGKGATAVSRCAPTNPAFSIPQAIGELREGVPSIIGASALWKSKTNQARAAGDEYLNVEFGWKPFVSELQSFARTVNASHEIWSNYRDGSGHKTRVGYHFDDEYQSRFYRGRFIPLPSEWYFNFPYGTAVQTLSQKEWFKGCFKYYVPEPSLGFSEKMGYWQSQASKILGIRLTPDTVWNLNPWTWAADWFANTGDLMTNISNIGTDGLVLQYGYQMAEETLHVDRAGTFEGSEDFYATQRRTTHKRCKRIRANPYGFNATLSTLTARQLAIIAALGLSST